MPVCEASGVDLLRRHGMELLASSYNASSASAEKTTLEVGREREHRVTEASDKMRDKISERLLEVRDRVADAAARSGRRVDEVELVAISKTHEAEKVREAMEAGQTLFGESRVQEARAKIPLLPSQLRWHFVGHLQTNKVRHALHFFEMIQSIDSSELAAQVNRIASEEGCYPRVLLEVNVSGEGSKFGFRPETLRNEMEGLLALGRISLEGLMTIPPLSGEPEKSRPYFAELRSLRDELEREFGAKLPHLSMGMSDDFAIAIEEGATLVRVGTAIFGERSRKARRNDAA
jgi:PLP dependent protein